MKNDAFSHLLPTCFQLKLQRLMSCQTGCNHRGWEHTTAQGSCSSTGRIITICLTPLTSHTPDLHTPSPSFHCRSHEEAFRSHYPLFCSSRASRATDVMKYVTAWAAHSHTPSLGIFQIHSDMNKHNQDLCSKYLASTN